MKVQATAAAAVALFSGLGFAQSVHQSKPFNLFVYSTNPKYNNTGLQSCHEGAGIESLCLGNGNAVYHVNTTTGQQSGVKGDSVPGTLTWLLPSSPEPHSEALGMFADLSTNVGHPQFGAGELMRVSFDQSNLMNIQTYLDDTVTPPTFNANGTARYRWVVCETNFEGYVYTTLNWVYGKAAAENPTCVSASVKRVFT